MQNKLYKVYGADISYFTGKVRAYLRWYTISHIWRSAKTFRG